MRLHDYILLNTDNFSSSLATIDGLHVTSQWPCWCSRNNKIFFLWDLTSIFMQTTYEQIFFCFVHQHGGNANHLLLK